MSNKNDQICICGHRRIDHEEYYHTAERADCTVTLCNCRKFSPTPPPNDLYEGMRLAGSLEKRLELESKLKHTEALLSKALDGFRTSNIVSACMALLAIVLLIAYFMK